MTLILQCAKQLKNKQVFMRELFIFKSLVLHLVVLAENPSDKLKKLEILK